MPGQGVRIGGGVKKGEWRCKVCKFKNVPNEEEDEEGGVERCNMCKEPK